MAMECTAVVILLLFLIYIFMLYELSFILYGFFSAIELYASFND